MPFPPPGDTPDPGIEPVSPALQADSLPSEPPVDGLYLDLCEIEDSRSDVMLLLKLSYKILQLHIRVNLSTSPDLGEAN